jgi:6-phosphogluconolactonase
MGKQPNLYSYPTIDDVAAHLRTYVLQAQKSALQRHDAFKIAVSGGSLPATLAKALLVPAENEDADSAPHFSPTSALSLSTTKIAIMGF